MQKDSMKQDSKRSGLFAGSGRRLWMWACALPLVASLVAFPQASKAEEVTVFAAASLTNAFQEMAKEFSAASGHSLRFSFAASSTLAKQIEQGAPAAVFVSADEKWMDYLAERKLIDPASRRDVAGNRLVFVMPLDRAKEFDTRPGMNLSSLVGDGRIATGDPAHVPVGRYAQQALEKLGLWSTVEPRLVRADSVRSALAFVERGEAPLGIVYETDAAVSTKVKIASRIDPQYYPKVIYPAAIVAGKKTAASSAFLDYLSSPAGVKVLAKYGFSKP